MRPVQFKATADWFQKFADRNAPGEDTDPRMIGGDGYELISCPTCEDEGLVYFYRIHPETKGPAWFLARCGCSAQALPAIYLETTSRAQEIPPWYEVKHPRTGEPFLSLDDLFPMRLQPYAAATGRLPFPLPEPLKVKYRATPKESKAGGRG